MRTNPEERNRRILEGVRAVVPAALRGIAPADRDDISQTAFLNMLVWSREASNDVEGVVGDPDRLRRFLWSTVLRLRGRIMERSARQELTQEFEEGSEPTSFDLEDSRDLVRALALQVGPGPGLEALKVIIEDRIPTSKSGHFVQGLCLLRAALRELFPKEDAGPVFDEFLSTARNLLRDFDVAMRLRLLSDLEESSSLSRSTSSAEGSPRPSPPDPPDQRRS